MHLDLLPGDVHRRAGPGHLEAPVQENVDPLQHEGPLREGDVQPEPLFCLEPEGHLLHRGEAGGLHRQVVGAARAEVGQEIAPLGVRDPAHHLPRGDVAEFHHRRSHGLSGLGRDVAEDHGRTEPLGCHGTREEEPDDDKEERAEDDERDAKGARITRAADEARGHRQVSGEWAETRGSGWDEGTRPRKGRTGCTRRTAYGTYATYRKYGRKARATPGGPQPRCPGLDSASPAVSRFGGSTPGGHPGVRRRALPPSPPGRSPGHRRSPSPRTARP